MSYIKLILNFLYESYIRSPMSTFMFHINNLKSDFISVLIFYINKSRKDLILILLFCIDIKFV